MSNTAPTRHPRHPENSAQNSHGEAGIADSTKGWLGRWAHKPFPHPTCHSAPTPALLPPSPERPREARLQGLALPITLLPAHQPSPQDGSGQGAWRLGLSHEGRGGSPRHSCSSQESCPPQTPDFQGEAWGWRRVMVEAGAGGPVLWSAARSGGEPARFLRTSPHQAQDLQPMATMSFNLGEGASAVTRHR